MTKEAKQFVQWHPAYYAALQLEFQEYLDQLEFEDEHQLSQLPLKIDVLVIKKKHSIAIKKNIGKLFRQFNCLEIKGPSDTLTIDDFYKVLGYAYIYKAITKHDSEIIPAEELTITFVCTHYPEKLMKYLSHNRGFTIRNIENGIYYIEDYFLPIQLLLANKLSESDNIWLHNLNNKLTKKDAEMVLTECASNSHKEAVTTYLKALIESNNNVLKEVYNMTAEKKKEIRDIFVEAGLMRDEVEIREETAEETTKEVKKDLAIELKNEGFTIEKIARLLKLSVDDTSKLLK